MTPQPWFWWLVLAALCYITLYIVVGWLRGYRWCKTCHLLRVHMVESRVVDYKAGPDGGQYINQATEFCPHCKRVRSDVFVIEPGLKSQSVRDSYRLWLEA